MKNKIKPVTAVFLLFILFTIPIASTFAQSADSGEPDVIPAAFDETLNGGDLSSENETGKEDTQDVFNSEINGDERVDYSDADFANVEPLISSEDRQAEPGKNTQDESVQARENESQADERQSGSGDLKPDKYITPEQAANNNVTGSFEEEQGDADLIEASEQNAEEAAELNADAAKQISDDAREDEEAIKGAFVQNGDEAAAISQADEEQSLNNDKADIDAIDETAEQDGVTEVENTEDLYAPIRIPIDENNFPDPVFRNYVKNRFDTNGDGILTATETTLVKRISLSSSGIGSLKGIESFPYLEYLYADGNDIASLDLTGNPRLTYVSVESNPLSQLTFAQDTPLETLLIWNTRLTNFDVSSFPDLKSFAFGAGSTLNGSTADFSANPKLNEIQYFSGFLTDIDVTKCADLTNIILSGCLVESVDVSQNADLIFFGGSGNRLHTMDFSNNPNLTTADVSRNELISIHGNGNGSVSLNAANLEPYIIEINDTNKTFDLSELDPKFTQGTITNLAGGTIENGVLTPDPDLSADNPYVTYTYADGGMSVDVRIEVIDNASEINEWNITPNIDNWTYGDDAAVPSSEPKYGSPDDVIYEYADRYAAGQGVIFNEFTEESASKLNAGTYLLRARLLPKVNDYTGLTGYVIFRVNQATPSYTQPSARQATYRDVLNDVELPQGFEWENPLREVGDVGEHTYYAEFTPEDTRNYKSVSDIEVAVIVSPKNGELCDISPITDSEQAENIVITDGEYTLIKDKDYTVSYASNGDERVVTINFEGNYYGEVEKTYTVEPEPSASASPSAEPTPTVTPSEQPTQSQEPQPTASPSADPTGTEEPTVSPSVEPTPSSSAIPTGTTAPQPTVSPNPDPTISPSEHPTQSPEPLPTTSSSAIPTGTAAPLSTASPNAQPTVSPSEEPAQSQPTVSPSAEPSVSASAIPTDTDAPQPAVSQSVQPTTTAEPSPTVSSSEQPAQSQTAASSIAIPTDTIEPQPSVSLSAQPTNTTQPDSSPTATAGGNIIGGVAGRPSPSVSLYPSGKPVSSKTPPTYDDTDIATSIMLIISCASVIVICLIIVAKNRKYGR